MKVENEYINAVAQLNNIYASLYENRVFPSNAWYIENSKGERKYVRSAIPFVGKEYFSNPNGCRVLLYASAENLSGYADGIEELSEEYRVHRCRQSFEASVAAGDFFPSVHIQPINDGGLLVVAYQILKRIMGEAFEKNYGNMQPAEFLEHICCSNYGKFTLHVGDGKTNYDYAGKKRILKLCHAYVKADIDVLKPDLIIMPKSMYEGAGQKKSFFEKYFSAEEFKVIPVYQVNSTVVNCHIGSKYIRKNINELTENEMLWHKNLKRVSQTNFSSVYSYVDSLTLK